MEQKFPEDNPTPTMPVEEELKIDLINPLEPTKNKGGNFLTVFLSILLLISVVIAGFFAYQTQKLVKEITKLQTIPTPIASIEPSATPDPTANWKTYIDKTFGFSLKYPDGYTISTETQGFTIFISPNTGENDALIISIGIYGGEFNGAPSDFLKDTEDYYKSAGAPLSSAKMITVNGMDVIYSKYPQEGGGEAYFLLHDHKRIMIDKQPVITSKQNEFEQILSTFKFTEPEASIMPFTSPQP